MANRDREKQRKYNAAYAKANADKIHARSTSPESRERRRELAALPENREKERARRATAEFKAKRKAHRSTPEYRAEANVQAAAYRVDNPERVSATKAAYYRSNRAAIRARQAAYYEQNRGEVLAGCSVYRAKHREKIKVRKAAYCREHAEEMRVNKAAYYELRRDEFRAKNLAYRKAHPDLIAVHRCSQRARKNSAPGSYTAAEWKAKKKSFGNRCIDCGMREGEKFANGKIMKLTVGHAVPLVRGGSNFIANLIPQCGPCNSRQGTKIHPSVTGLSLFDRPSAAQTPPTPRKRSERPAAPSDAEQPYV